MRTFSLVVDCGEEEVGFNMKSQADMYIRSVSLTFLMERSQPRTANFAVHTNDRPFLAFLVLVSVQLKSGHSSVTVLTVRRHFPAGLLDCQVSRAVLLRNQASTTCAGGLFFFEPGFG